MSLHKGIVVRFGPKGFGFITESGTGLQWFFHVNDVAGRRELRAGEKVRFQEGISVEGKAPRAVCVELVAESPTDWVAGLDIKKLTPQTGTSGNRGAR